MRLFRLLKIIYITLKFGLDEFILAHSKVRPLRQMMLDAGLAKVDYYNLAAGVVALHKGWKA